MKIKRLYMVLSNFTDNPNVNQIIETFIDRGKFAIYENFCGLARNRTWIWSFGNSYTIHCTTRPCKDAGYRIRDTGKSTSMFKNFYF